MPTDFFGPLSDDEKKTLEADKAKYFYPLKDEEKPVSLAESAIRATGQGLTGGFHDEMAAALKATAEKGNIPGTDQWWKDYREERDFIRARMAESQKEHPAVWGGLNFAGALLGAGKLATVGKAAKSADVAQKVSKIKELMSGAGKIAGGGALAGLGLSDADLTQGEVGQALEDAKTGAIYGLGTAGVLKGAAKGGHALLTKAPKKLLASMTGVDEKVTDAYLANPKGISKARQVDEIADDLQDKLEKLKQRVMKGSREASEELKGKEEVPTVPIISKIRELMAEISDDVTDEGQGAVKELSRIGERLQGKGESIPLERLKKVVQGIDRSLEKGSQSGEFMTPAHIQKTRLRQEIDAILKDTGKAPGYAAKMVEVAKDTKALADAAKYFGNPNAAVTKLKGVIQRPEQRLLETRALEAFDKRMGTNFGEENRFRHIKEAFEKDNTRGSRSTLFGTAVGALAGTLGGPFGILGGAAGGAAIGHTVLDKYGGRLAKYLLDKYAKSAPSLEGPKSLGSLLQRNMQKGATGQAATHFLLTQIDPEYQKKVIKENK